MSDDDNRGATGPDRAGSTPSDGGVPIAAPAPAWWRLPVELRQRHQWLLAGPDLRGDLKVPTSVNAAGELVPGSSTARHTWLTFERAVAVACARGLGLGYVLAYDDPFCCIDLDVKNYVNYPNNPEKWTSTEHIQRMALRVSELDSYTERSQSGVGLHVWVLGKIGGGKKRDGIELYSQERFIACTGDVYMDRPLRDHQQWLTEQAAQMEDATAKDKDILTVEEPEDVALTDAELYQKRVESNLGWKFFELWHGRWEQLIPSRRADMKAKFNEDDPDVSQSAFDLELFSMLIFNRANCQRNREQAVRMFLSSPQAANINRRGSKRLQQRYAANTLACALDKQAKDNKKTRDAMNTWLRSGVDEAWAAEFAQRAIQRIKGLQQF